MLRASTAAVYGVLGHAVLIGAAGFAVPDDSDGPLSSLFLAGLGAVFIGFSVTLPLLLAASLRSDVAPPGRPVSARLQILGMTSLFMTIAPKALRSRTTDESLLPAPLQPMAVTVGIIGAIGLLAWCTGHAVLGLRLWEQALGRTSMQGAAAIGAGTFSAMLVLTAALSPQIAHIGPATATAAVLGCLVAVLAGTATVLRSTEVAA